MKQSKYNYINPRIIKSVEYNNVPGPSVVITTVSDTITIDCKNKKEAQTLFCEINKTIKNYKKGN